MECPKQKDKLNTSLNTYKLGIIWKAYLALYNLAMLIGWLYVFSLMISFYIDNTGKTCLFGTVKLPLFVVISFAFLEGVHVYAGIANYTDQKMVARCQMILRSYVAQILYQTSPEASAFGEPFMLFAWFLTEVIRYGYCFFNIIAHYRLSAGLKWTLKLTAIIGAFGEQFCLWNATQIISYLILWNAKDDKYRNALVVVFIVSLFQLMVFCIQFKYAYNLPSWPRNVIEEKEIKHDREMEEPFLFMWIAGYFDMCICLEFFLMNFYYLGIVLAETYPSIIEYLFVDVNHKYENLCDLIPAKERNVSCGFF